MSFSLSSLVSRHAQARPEHPALVFGATTRSYGELDRRANRTANALASLGVGRGDRVATLHRNCPELFDVMIAANRIGAVTVAVNWRLSPREVAHILADSGARVLFCDQEQADELKDELVGTAVDEVICIGESARLPGFDEWIAAQPDLAPTVEVRLDDVAVQFYTSGTTGLPKGALITNRNLGTLVPHVCELWDFDADSVNLVAMPLFHIGGSGWALNTFYVGGTAILLDEVSGEAVLEAIAGHRVTNAFMVPAVLQLVLDTNLRAARDLDSLRCVVYGASPITPALLGRVVSELRCQLVQAYGLTETTGAITMLSAADHELAATRPELLQSCGRAFPWVELKIVSTDADAAPCPPGVVGEIWARSTQNMAGYWNLPEATAKAIDADGWCHTGDAGYLDDDGYLFIRDRINDMIISGGENIYPAEIENVLASHPAVVDAAVVGVPDEKWGEAVKAFVVLVSGAAAAEDELIDFCRTQLARYKCPKSVEFVAELPRNASGKVLRRQLR